MAALKYPIGIQNFEKIRKDGFLYIDKTTLMYKLVQEGNYYFLSRPRRFGKSLLLSTLHAYFEGKKELFDGLAVANLEKEWQQYPVLHLDLNTGKYSDAEALNAVLDVALSEWERLYEKSSVEQSLSSRFMGIIRRAYEQTGQRVVILVDEYDKPLLQTIDNDALQTDYRNTLKAFYGALKTCDEYIKFAFLTGVTKFGKVSVFSDLNNLNDLSMDSKFTGICGITETEMHECLDDCVEELAEANHIGKADCYARLKELYDGYHFCPGTEGVYNPFSVLNTFLKKAFGMYWFETGTPTFLVEMLKKTDYPLENMTQEEITGDILGCIDVMNENPLPLIYQSGYLTLRDYDPVFQVYTLGYPNQEVELGFTRFLLPYYVPRPKNATSFFIKNFVQEIQAGNAQGFMKRLDSLFADGNYQLVGDAELYFQNAVFLIFKMMGFYVCAERPTSDGRMDMLVQTSDYVYIFEFKINQSAEVALQQIDAKNYVAPFEADNRKIFKIGVNFSTQLRRIDDWKIVE